jgi:hypothetical protein
MRKIAKANQKELSRFANIPAPRKPFLFDIKSPNNNPSAINYQGVSSSISDSKSLIQKIVDNEKDIKRIYKPKAIK